MKRKAPAQEVLVQDYESGMSHLAIGEKYGIAASAVQKHLKKAGVKSRSLSEAHTLAYQSGRHIPKGAKGESHWAWKGGSEQREYRNKVKKEKCATCGIGANLCIHHVDFDHYNNHPDNLQVLCVSCHHRLHKQAYWDSIKAGEAPKKSNGPVGWERS